MAFRQWSLPQTQHFRCGWYLAKCDSSASRDPKIILLIESIIVRVENVLSGLQAERPPVRFPIRSLLKQLFLGHRGQAEAPGELVPPSQVFQFLLDCPVNLVPPFDCRFVRTRGRTP